MFEYFKNDKQKIIQLNDISNKFSSNDVICRQMLEILENKSTDVKLEKDIKNNYYVFLNDSIYLCDKDKNKKDYKRICIIAHECIHSIQNKIMQIINFAVSNIELIAFVITALCVIFKFHTNIIMYCYLAINIISAIPRLMLEMDATIRSINLSKKYIKDKIDENESHILLKEYKSKMLLFSPFFVISLLIGRIIRIVVVCLLYKL